MTSENSISLPASLSEKEEDGWEPQIVAFCCRHCAYAAADLAGGLRLAYPSSIKVFELPCTGRLDVLHVLRTFEDGADGVMVAG
jgi:F420-non-reducing hydrogenase iron-sulfur subunit